MRTIWKYQVPVTDAVEVPMPQFATLLPYIECEGAGQLRILTFWAEVDTRQPTVSRALHVIGTGNPIGERDEYVGTARDGVFMWHLYDGDEVVQ